MGKKSVNNGVRFDAERYAATADAWGQNSKTSDETFEYVTESGKPVLIKKLGIEDVLEMGLFDKLDFFTKALAEIDTKKPGQAPEGEAGSFAVNALKNFGQLKSTIHRILLAGVIAPVLHPVPEPPAVKKDGVLYVDSVPFEECLELFGEILDMEGLSTFRKESEADMGDVPADESVQNSTE